MSADPFVVTCDGGRLEWRRTPWDERVLGAPTAEVTRIDHDGPPTASRLVDALVRRWLDEGVLFGVTRVPSTDAMLRRVLALSDFWAVEQSLSLRPGRTRQPATVIAPEGMVLETPATDEDFDRIAWIARDDFHYGRIHEDPRIPISLARERNFRWVHDLRDQRREFRVFRLKGRIEGFHVQTVRDTYADLILTGTSARAAMLSLPFWASILAELRDRGVGEAHPFVSAANAGALNLWARLGYSFDESFVGHHWMHASLRERFSSSVT